MTSSVAPERPRLGDPSAPAWTILEGDAWDLAKTVEDDSVDLLLTSPPFWALRTYGHSHNERILDDWRSSDEISEVPSYEWYRKHGGVLGMEPFPAWFVSHLVEIFGAFERSLKPDGSLWINLGDTYFGRWASIRDDGRQGLGDSPRTRRRTPSGGSLHDKQMLMIPARFAIAMQDAGWILRNDLIWSKPNVAPRPEKDRLKLTHEHFFHFVKRSKVGRPSYFYDIDEVESGARDVVVVPPTRGDGGHSATFPLQLVAPRIRSSSRDGGLVLDPFCGSGSTLVSAVAEGRRALGFELSSQFAESATKRLTDQDEVLSGRRK